VRAKQDVTLTGGTQNVSIRLDAGATLAVSLVDAQGNPAAGYVILVNKNNDRHWAMSGKDGRCAFAFLEPSEYSAEIRPSSQDFAALSTKVEVKAGANACTVKMAAADCMKLTWVAPNSDAANAGLQKGDLLLSFGGKLVTGMTALNSVAGDVQKGADVTIKVLRDGAETTLTVKGWSGGRFGAYGIPAVRG
jgi:membrane-associated protease RseP (regulator of RpoE activity)